MLLITINIISVGHLSDASDARLMFGSNSNWFRFNSIIVNRIQRIGN